MANVSDVNGAVEDKQESYFLAETLKYADHAGMNTHQYQCLRVSYALVVIIHVGVLWSLTMCLCDACDLLQVPGPAVLAPPQHRLGQVCVQHRGSPPALFRCVSQP